VRKPEPQKESWIVFEDDDDKTPFLLRLLYHDSSPTGRTNRYRFADYGDWKPISFGCLEELPKNPSEAIDDYQRHVIARTDFSVDRVPVKDAVRRIVAAEKMRPAT
jgi:hypothetical protein